MYIYIYIRRPSNCNYILPFLKIPLLDFDQTFRDGGLKISQNGYRGNEKKPKMVFLPEKPLELEI